MCNCSPYQQKSPEMSLGNHELDEAVEGVIPFIRNLSSPVLAANLILDNAPELRAEENLKNSIVITIKGVKIGIIGYLTPDTKFLAPKNKVEYEDELVALKREVNILRDQNVNILIALGHSGFLKDLDIAREVMGIDLVIGGHSNTFLWNDVRIHERPETPQGPYPFLVKQLSGKIVPVVQAYAYTKYLGKLHLIFDKNGEIIKMDGDPILLDQQIPEDAEVLEIVNEYRSKINKINEEVVGTSTGLLDGEQCRLRECSIGTIVTDAILEYIKNHQDDIHNCINIAIIQGGRIRSSIDHPERPFGITKGDWLTVLPYTDALTVVTMNGSTLLKTLEHSADTWRKIDSTGQFLQMSGIEVVYDLAKPPGSRVQSAKAVISDCGESRLLDVRENIEYKVIMPGFLAEGGDGYTFFQNLTMEPMRFNEIVCVLEYIHSHSPIEPKLSGSITLLNEDKTNSLENIHRYLASGAYKLNYCIFSVVSCLIVTYLQLKV